ncbi:hypothetical protein SARC_06315 [Sphaeroforma arctica JP610]|uniref:GH26 domain-containing protein n=1 Tax=Sphaeroforma arctica JP610 TaxID=667725 RepID=A0A0L0FWY5_9EUKA|nr:hypothetical protein SARC_06315 [Sphaeroforma arctica JP610]KNC81355.1 hypothetical protein SARC_06315 [Sphaeroforma arctica JP610]|eukprot:XP_014155257.1 hypothetical protein SARC_06315 [Sphaeroforma arctica JP610]
MQFPCNLKLAYVATLCALLNVAVARTTGQGLHIIARFRAPKCSSGSCDGGLWDEIDGYVKQAKQGKVPIMININHEWKIANNWSTDSKKYVSDMVKSYVKDGAIVTAYVSTDYGVESESDVKGNVEKWLTSDFGYDYPCPITGIFFDEAPADPRESLYKKYEGYTNYARSIMSDAFIFYNAGGTWSSSSPYQKITSAYCVREKPRDAFMNDWPSQAARWIKDNDMEGYTDSDSGTQMGQTGIIIYDATESYNSWEGVFKIGQDNNVKWVSTTTDYERLPDYHVHIIDYLCEHTYGDACKLTNE